MRVSQSSLPPIALLVRALIDAGLRNSLTTARNGVTEDDTNDEAYSFWARDTRHKKGKHVAQPEHSGHSSNVEGGRDGDQDNAADVTDATGNNVEETDHIKDSLRPHGIANSDSGVTSTSFSSKRRLPFLATGGSVKSSPAPQHHCKRRRRHDRFSAPEPSDEEGAAELSGCNKSHPNKRPLESGSSRQQRRTKRRRMRFSQVLHSSSEEMNCGFTSSSEFEPAPPMELSGRARRGTKAVQAPTSWPYETGAWESRIIDERTVRQRDGGPGRPRTQYLVQAWVDGECIRQAGLLEGWKQRVRRAAEL